MDIEGDVYHDLFQNKDNFYPATGEDATADRQRGAEHVYECTGLAAELVVLVRAAGRLPAEHRRNDGCRVTS